MTFRSGGYNVQTDNLRAAWEDVAGVVEVEGNAKGASPWMAVHFNPKHETIAHLLGCARDMDHTIVRYESSEDNPHAPASKMMMAKYDPDGELDDWRADL